MQNKIFLLLKRCKEDFSRAIYLFFISYTIARARSIFFYGIEWNRRSAKHTLKGLDQVYLNLSPISCIPGVIQYLSHKVTCRGWHYWLIYFFKGNADADIYRSSLVDALSVFQCVVNYMLHLNNLSLDKQPYILH